MQTVSSCLPVEAADRQYAAIVDQAELIGREHERRVEEEIAWMLHSPEVLAERINAEGAGNETLALILCILFDKDDDKLARIRDHVWKELRRFSEAEADRC